MQKELPSDVALWVERFERSRSHHEAMRGKWSRWYKSMLSSNDLPAAPWRSKVVDPKIASKARSILAKVSLYDPQPNLIPNDRHDYLKARNNEMLLSNDLENPLMDQSMFLKKYSSLSDAVVCGTGIALVPWTFETKTFYSRVRGKDGKVDMTNEKKTEVKVGYNDFKPFSIFRYFPEPNAESDQKARWMILQDFMSGEEISAVTDKKVSSDELSSMSGDDASNTKRLESARNAFVQSEDTQEGQTEVWHCFDRVEGTYTFVIGGAKVGFHEKNRYWHQKYPIVTFRVTPRAHSVFGVGIFETTERLGAANDSLINHFFDQLDLSLNGMVMRDSSTDILDWNIAPGGELVYQGAVKPEFVAIPQPDMQGFQVGRQILSEAIEENTISQYEVGIPRSAADQTQGTKGGIEAIQNAASDMVRFFERCYAESHKALYQLWLSNNQQFMDRERAVRVLGANGFWPKVLKPEDIVTIGSLDVDVDVDAMRPRTKELQRAQTEAWVEKMLEIAQISQKAAQLDPSGQTKPLTLNYYELARSYSEASDIRDFDRVVEPQLDSQDGPEQENDLMLMGKEPEPLEADDHELHILVHQELAEDKGLDQEVIEILMAHIKMHEQFQEIIKERKDQEELAQLKQMDEQVSMAAGTNVNQILSENAPEGATPAGMPVQPQLAQPNAPQNQPIQASQTSLPQAF